MVTQIVTADEWTTNAEVNGSMTVEWFVLGEEPSGNYVSADTLIFRACPPQKFGGV